MDVSPALITFGIIAFALVMIALALYQRKKYEERKAALAAWAAGQGLQFYPDGVEVATPGLFSSYDPATSFLGPYQQFAPFGQGDRWQVPLMIQGSRDGLTWTIFDYKYETETTTTDSEGRTTTRRDTHPYTVASAELPLSFPRIDIRPEGFFDKIGGALGFHDLNFELDEFNRRYYVKAENEKIAYGLIHPQMIEYLMRIPCRHWQIAGNLIVIAEPGWRDLPEIDRVVTDMRDFYNLIPDYMRQDLGVRA